MGTQYDAKTLECYKKKALNVKVDQEEMMLTSTGSDGEDKCRDISPQFHQMREMSATK